MKDTQRKQDQKRQPKRSYRKLLRRLFWTIFFLMLAFCIVVLVRTAGIYAGMSAAHEALRQEIAEVEKKEAAGTDRINREGAKLFALDFVKEYYTWTNTETKAAERAKRLEQYLVSGLDAGAGYDISKTAYRCNYIGGDIYKVESETDGCLIVTVKVRYVLYEQKTRQIIKKTGTGKKAKTQISQEKYEVSAGTYIRYIAVPLVAAGDGFYVTDIPYLVKVNPAEEPEPEQPVQRDAFYDPAVTEEIKEFIATFFSVLTKGKELEFSYYSESEVKSLSGLYEFVSVQNPDIYKADDSDTYEVKVTVILKDVTTKAQVVKPVSCVVYREGNRYKIKNMEM